MKLLYKPIGMKFRFKVPYLDSSEGWQKVMGFSYWHHHYHSLRLGIKRHQGSDIYAFSLYGYIRGKRVIVPIKTDKSFIMGDIIDCTLIQGVGSFYVRIRNYGKDVRTYSAIHKFEPYKWLFPIGYKLYPYAETDGKNPKEIVLNIEFL